MAALPRSGRTSADAARELATAGVGQILDLQALVVAQQAEIEQFRSGPRPLLTYSQACAVLGVMYDKLQSLIKAGELPIVNLGAQSPRIRPADLEALIANLTVLHEARPALREIARLPHSSRR